MANGNVATTVVNFDVPLCIVRSKVRILYAAINSNSKMLVEQDIEEEASRDTV